VPVPVLALREQPRVPTERSLGSSGGVSMSTGHRQRTKNP